MIVVALLMLAATIWLVGVGNRAIEDLALIEGEIGG